MNVIGVGDIIKLCEIAGRVYKNCRDCTGEYKSLTSEARTLTNLLEDIQDKFDKIPENKHRQLEDAYTPCIEVLQELDKLLKHYNSLDTKSKRAWDRLKWDPDKSRTLRARLSSSVTMLNAFYTSMIHDSQVRILEALGRLELDYKGGHREESIASLERITLTDVDEDDEEGDAAWTQILRDLEDVGVAKQEALSYRDMIVDWLVRAVNEGRLLEQRPSEPITDGLATMPEDPEVTLPTEPHLDVELPGTHYLDVPDLFSSIQRSQSAPHMPPSPPLGPTVGASNRSQSIPSTTSLPIVEPSGRSSYAHSSTSETSTSSLYAWPQPTHQSPPPASLNPKTIKRVPVPMQLRAPSLDSTRSSNVAVEEMVSAISYTTPTPPTRMAPPVPTGTYREPTSPPLPIPADINNEPFSMLPIPVDTHNDPLYAPQVYHAMVETTEPPAPPSYYDKKETITADLAWTAQQIIAAWGRRDFPAAEKHLEEQLAAVERGQTVIATGLQPDRRILRHLIGVCASYTGNFKKAKTYFESVFNGIYLHRANLDEGDIAAARWLGDVCMHLREHQNAVLAWSVAFEGCLGRYGIARDRTNHVANELRLLDKWLAGFQRVNAAFTNNMDPTDIFKQTHAMEKNNLMASVQMQLIEVDAMNKYRYGTGMTSYVRPGYSIGSRPKTEESISQGFLLAPLISMSVWPMAWDHTFSPVDCVQLDRCMNIIRISRITIPLVQRSLPSATLGASKELHYITKKGSQWLIETVKKSLSDLCIEHAEHIFEPIIVCCLNQHRGGYAFSKSVEISFKKLQLRKNVCGIKISDVRWATRSVGLEEKDTSDFRDILRAVLEDAEKSAVMEGMPELASVPVRAHYG